MVSDASARLTNPKVNGLIVHTAETFSNRACAQDGYFKCPLPTIIDGEIPLDRGWFLVGFWVVGHLTCN
jgi:hypothetical protein